MNFSRLGTQGVEVRDTLKNSLLPLYKTNIISRWLHRSPPCDFVIKLLRTPWSNYEKDGKRGEK